MPLWFWILAVIMFVPAYMLFAVMIKEFFPYHGPSEDPAEGLRDK